MGQEEQDRIVGRLFREAKDARQKSGIVAAEIKNVTEALKELARELPEMRSTALDSRHASLGKYVNLEAIRSLLEQREAAASTVEDFERRIRDLG